MKIQTVVLHECNMESQNDDFKVWNLLLPGTHCHFRLQGLYLLTWDDDSN